uniref:KIND domain-containing protein n=1 Tax=Mola mola TaxID=94237 RepID=A0A3Q3WZT7_MOLML
MKFRDAAHHHLLINHLRGVREHAAGTRGGNTRRVRESCDRGASRACRGSDAPRSPSQDRGVPERCLPVSWSGTRGRPRASCADGMKGCRSGAAAPRDGPSPAEDCLSLEEILGLYGQPINEEQAWAVCFQCCRTLARGRRGRRSSSAAQRLKRAFLRCHRRPPPVFGRVLCSQVIESLGIMIYKALDYGLKENEERELSPPLEELIALMTNMAEGEGDTCPDEGYEATEEEDEAEDDLDLICSVHGYRDIVKLCTAHLPGLSDASSHYQAVCRALYAETRELHTFLEKIKSAKENLRKMEAESSEEPGRDLNELQNADWARCWVQVMRDLREGLKLKKVQERQYNPLPIEYQLTPYEMLMDDIRSRRYKLRKVMVNGDIPPRLKKSAHEVILEFIRSRPPLNPVSARKLKPPTQPPPTLHERILEGIKAERKLRPVSPGEVRRGRLGKKTQSTSSSLSLSNGSASPRAEASGSQSVPQRKRLLKAPSLAELDSSDSDVSMSLCARGRSSEVLSGVSEQMMIEVLVSPPMFLPISSTPQPERRQTPQRRHSIEKETPTNVRQFQPPAKKSSKSLEEFCFPVECLSLTVEEVMHIRQVLVKAELEKFQQYKDIYTAMKKGKLCFCCRTKRFSFFTWSYICQFCKKPVCSQCCKKVRETNPPFILHSKFIFLFYLGRPNIPACSASRPCRFSKHGSLKSHEELELPTQLTEDWATMEVCVDCKKFITDIIASSKHSLSLATKRARLKRKTQSFYLVSPKGREDYRPSERTIKEI